MTCEFLSRSSGPGLSLAVDIVLARDLKQNTTATATRTSPNKRFNEQNNSCKTAA